MNLIKTPHKTKSVTLTNETTIFYNLLKYTRKTLELSISPTKTITVKAPWIMPNNKIEAFLIKKSNWIIKKLNKKTLIRKAPKKLKFKNEEVHNYLGNSYKLKIVKADINEVELTNNQFEISTKDTTQAYVKELLYIWYAKQARIVFPKIYDQCWKEFTLNSAYKPPIMKIKKVKSIWGSLSTSNNMTINLELIRFPEICIKYIFFHELSHLKHKNHGVGFKELLTQNMPNWKIVKKLLQA